MHQDARRKRPGTVRHERIQGEADITYFGELDVGLHPSDGRFRRVRTDCGQRQQSQEQDGSDVEFHVESSRIAVQAGTT